MTASKKQKELPASAILHRYRCGRRAYLKGKALHAGAGTYYRIGYKDASREGISPVPLETTCAEDIVNVLQKNRDGLTYESLLKIVPYKLRTIRKHMAYLLKTGTVEAVIKGNMRKPLYRVVR